MKYLQLHKLFALVFLFSLLGCEPVDERLTFVNNSNDTLYYLWRPEDLPDYRLAELINDRLPTLESVRPNGITKITLMSNWSMRINDFEDSSIHIFFLSKELKDKLILQDSVIETELYSKRVKLTVEDLDESDWKVYYP